MKGFMWVMTASGWLLSTIVLVLSVVGPPQKPICVISRWSACKARTRARQSRDQACVIWSKLLNLFEVPVINWIMLSADGVTVRIKATGVHSHFPSFTFCIMNKAKPPLFPTITWKV